MLHTSLRVIHQTPRFTVTKFSSVDGGPRAFVIEKLNPAGETVAVESLDSFLATIFESAWKEAIAQSVNTRPIAKPFAVDELLERYFQ